MIKSHASNIKSQFEVDNVTQFVEKPGFELLTALTASYMTTTGSHDTIKTPAIKRLGLPVERKTVVTSSHEDLGIGGERLGSVTVFGNGTDTTDIDALRQGKNVTSFRHFSKGTLPFITVNTPELDSTNGHFVHNMINESYGQGSLFRTYDDRTRKLIPFEDFPGRLDPVAYVGAGEYILQYMIINDLTRDVDKFIDPDTMDGVIEVFEIRQKFANTSFADINLFGIRADMSLGDSNYSVKGSNFMSSRIEKVQKKVDYYEDSNETLFGTHDFIAKGASSGSLPNRDFALDGFIHDEFYRVTPFIESSELSTSFIFVEKLENFALQNNLSFEVVASNSSKRNFSDVGSRFTGATSGFIFNKSNISASNTGMSNNISGITINLGTDSLAFGGFTK